MTFPIINSWVEIIPGQLSELGILVVPKSFADNLDPAGRSELATITGTVGLKDLIIEIKISIPSPAKTAEISRR